MTQDLVRFFLVGAARSGTTALADYLEQHPEVFISDPKEPHYFAFQGRKPGFIGPGDKYFNNSVVYTAEKYKRLFAKASPTQIAGDASVSYLYYSESLKRIQSKCPNAKIICILRHPVDRAYSAFMRLTSRLLETEQDFELAFHNETRLDLGWHHLWHYEQMSHYGPQLESLFQTFDRKQVLVLLYDDFKANSIATVQQCFRFLEIDDSFVPPAKPDTLVSGVPRNRLLQSFAASDRLKSILRPLLSRQIRNRIQSKMTKLNVDPARIDPALRDRLTPLFLNDVEVVEEVLKRKLPNWKVRPNSLHGVYRPDSSNPTEPSL